MSESAMIFEQFDDAIGGNPSDIRAQQKRAADYAEGFAAGEAAALSRAMEQNVQLQRAADALKEKLISFDDLAASQLCEALSSAVKKIFPALTASGFTHEATAALSEFVQKNDKANLIIKTAQANFETVSAAIAALPIAARAKTLVDETLSEFEVCAEWDHGGISIDTEKATACFIASLEQAMHELRDEDKNVKPSEH